MYDSIMARYREPFSIFRFSNGYWYFWYYDRNGVRRKKSTGKKRKSSAMTYAYRYVSALPASGTLRGYTNGWFQRDSCPWTRMRSESGSVPSDAYLALRYGYLNNYILVAFGSRIMSDVTTQEVQSWLYSLDRSAQTKKHIRKCLFDIYEYALRYDNSVPSNPVGAVPIPSGVSVRYDILTDEETESVVNAALREDPRRGIALYILWQTGIRSGELLGLRPIDLIVDPPSIMVRQNVRDAGVARPKSKASVRATPITADLLAVVQLCIIDLKEADRIFPETRRTLSRWLNDAIAASQVSLRGRRIVIHSFRNEHNSRFLGKIDGDILRTSMGHVSERMTDRYDRRFLETLVAMLDPMRAFLPVAQHFDRQHTERQSGKTREAP